MSVCLARSLPRSNARHLLLIASLLLPAAGCAVGPNHTEPTMDVAASWPLTGEEAGPELASWWQVFDDPVLNDLVRRAIEANLELKVADARVEETRALRRVTSGSLWPGVNTSTSYSRSTRGTSAGEGVDSGGTGREGDLFRASLDALWEIDLFGRVRRASEAARADAAVAEEERRAVLVRLLGDVAATYVEIRGLEAELASTVNNLDAQRETLRLSTLRREVGLASDFDVERSRALVASTAAEVPALEGDRAAAVHRLAILVGESPARGEALLGSGSRVPRAPEAIAMGVPADLLRRRPDVRAAEREIAAATARIGEAKALLLPRLTLLGTVGLRSEDIARFATGESLVSTFGPSLTVPLFSAGRGLANVSVHDARRDQAFAQWELAVLRALEEVETAHARLEAERARRVAIEEAAAANRIAASLANELWASGLADFLEVLVAERSRFESERLLARSEAAVATRVAALYVALGGGWEAAPDGGADGRAEGRSGVQAELRADGQADAQAAARADVAAALRAQAR